MEKAESIPVNPGGDFESPGTGDFPSAFVLSGAHAWVILFAGVCILAFWKKFAEPHYQRWQQRRALNEEILHRDDEASLARDRAVQSARSKLQAQMDAAAEKHKETIRQKEEAKRQARLLVYQNLQQGRSNTSSSTSSTSNTSDGANQNSKKPKEERLRGDFFPLMGSEPGTCFRPSRRGGGSAGG